MNRKTLTKSLLALTAFAMTSTVTIAQTASSTVLEEIIVTAQKRAEAVSDVPIALSAFTGDFIKEAKINDLKELVRYTPGLAGESADSNIDTLSVRGISTNAFGIGGDSSIGIYKNGIYYGRNGAAMSSFFDIERVEVLKGPQGLLFGRNAASGAIHTITEKPKLENVEGYIKVGAGEHNRRQVEFAYNQPLADGWAARIAGIHSEEDGFIENLFNGEDLGGYDRDALRLSLKNEGDWGDITLVGEYEDRKQSGTIFIGQDENGNTFTGDNRKANTDFPDEDEAKVRGLTLTANFHLNDKMTLTSITGYNKHEWVYQEDWDGTPFGFAGFIQDQEGEYYSQEMRLNVDVSEKLNWYIGASIYKEEVSAFLANDAADVGPVLGVPFVVPLLETNNTEGEYSGWAVYGDMTYKLTDKMDLSLGVRYTYDEKDTQTDIQGQGFVWSVVTPSPVKATQDWDDVSPRITLRYFTDSDVMVYGSVTEGYKAGGFGTDDVTIKDPFGIALPGATLDGFDPETVRSYEVGAKGSLADGKVKFGISAYYYDYQDLQTVIIEVGKALVANIGEVDGYGVELDMRAAITDNWSAFLGAAWSESDISGIPLDVCLEPTGSNCNGNRLGFNPDVTIAAGLNAVYPVVGGEVVAGLDFTWQDEFYSGLENQEPQRVDNAGFANFRAGWNSEKNWNLMVYVENLFDEESFSSRGAVADGFNANNSPSRPRTAGVDFTYQF